MEIQTPIGAVSAPNSELKFNNTKSIRKQLVNSDGTSGELVISIRWDDNCHNGFNTFSVTADEYRFPQGRRECVAGGCLHKEIAKHAPELAFALPYHLVSANGPMHYFANTTYLAGDLDFQGGAKGIQRKKNGLLAWQLAESPYSVVYSNEKPESLTGRYTPIFGAGKPRELDPARSAAVWPDATDADLCVTKEELERALALRLPALMLAFKSVVEQLGFEY